MLNTVGERSTNLLLILIFAIYLALAAGYGLLNPLFEAPDENHHFYTIRYIARNKALPNTFSAGESLRQEAAQPPLYYLLAAPLLMSSDRSELEEPLWFNATVELGRPRPINVNAFVHTDRETWPWQGYSLSAHLVRLLSAIIGLGTLLAIFGSARLIWPQSPTAALLAVALVAFLPQFGFLHGAITNDVLIIFLSSFALWQMLRLWFLGITPVRLILLGVTSGLAVLAKMTGLALIVLSLLVLAMIAWRDRPAVTSAGHTGRRIEWRTLIWSAILVVLPAFLVSGWLLWRNWTLYGDVTATNQFIALAGGNRHYTLRQVWRDLDRVLLSAVAFFGWMNVLAPRWLYFIWAAIGLLSGAGWLYAARRSVRPHSSGVLPPGNRRAAISLWMGIWFLLVFLAWLRFMMQTPADQGRLLFPALLPVALFAARGIVLLRLRWLPWLAAIAALATSMYALLVIIPAAYKGAEVLLEHDVPPDTRRLDLEMGKGIELLAVFPHTESVHPGEWVWVDLYWRAEQPPREAPFERMSLVGRQNTEVGKQVNYHGGGTYPANLWSAGKIIKDRVGIQLARTAQLPTQLRFLLRIDESREPVEIARLKAIPETWPEADGLPLARFGDGIDLTAASFSPAAAPAGSQIAVDVQWTIESAPPGSPTTFVHLGDPARPPLAQGDGPALSGDYPSDRWAAGEVIDDHYTLSIPHDLPSGTYPLHIGFYNPVSGDRLPVRVSGLEQPNNAYPLGSLIVEAN